jgi:hypothetical protein
MTPKTCGCRSDMLVPPRLARKVVRTCRHYLILRPQSELDQAADGFGAADLVILHFALGRLSVIGTFNIRRCATPSCRRIVLRTLA